MRLIGKQFYVALISAILGALLTIFILSGTLQRMSIDVLNYFLASETTSGEIVVVGIDDTSFQLWMNLLEDGHGQDGYTEI